MSQPPGPPRTFATYTEMAAAEPYLLAGHTFG